MSAALYIEQYADLPKVHKDLARGLFLAECKRRRGHYKQGIFFSKAKMAEVSKCCSRTIQRFNNLVKFTLIGVIKRFRPNGSQTTNKYEFDPQFFEAMFYLKSHNLLYKSKSEILKFYRQNENVSPPLPDLSPPYPNYSLTKDKEYKREYVHPKLLGIKIDHQTKISLSLYPEHAIMKGLEDTAWWWRQGNRPTTTLEAVITSRVKEHV